MTTKPRKTVKKKAPTTAVQAFEFKIRDLLVTQVPSWKGAGASCDCDSSCSAVTQGHPVHTDFCGRPGDIFSDPPDIKDLKVAVRKMKPLTRPQLTTLEKSLNGALKEVRTQLKG